MLDANKGVLVKIAEELLIREVLDADQVTRLASGEPLDDIRPASATPERVVDEQPRRGTKERPSIVPPIPPLNKPLPQE
jgi:hypothetical protein